MTLDFSFCRLPPFQHQREDTEWLIDQPYAFIASEMRTGKSKIVIDAAQFLYTTDQIDRMIVVAPAPVRDVWFDPDLGEIAKHVWDELTVRVIEFHSTTRVWKHPGPRNTVPFDIYVTNYEFLRRKAWLKQLLAATGQRTLLVGDESSFLKNHQAAQTKSFLQLRRRCGRVVLLNGTPIYHTPLDLFSQGNILSPKILDCPYVTLFKARYAVQQPVLGRNGKPIDNGHGKPVLKIAGWANLDDLEKRFAPYTRRRLQADCLDLPPKLDPITLTATLTPETWKTYRQMRDDLVVWLSQQHVSLAATAAIKVLRLAQITGGFLGGAEDANVEPVESGFLESLDLRHLLTHLPSEMIDTPIVPTATTAIGREKIDVLLWLIGERLKSDPNLHIVCWHRFRDELFRTIDAVKEQFPQFTTGMILGDQKKQDRIDGLALLKPETSPKGPVFVGGIEGTGSFGIDMTAADTCVTLSSGYSPGRSLQTLDRVYGPGQQRPVNYFNIIAVGPKGQHTIDRDILLTRTRGEDIALRTAHAWVQALKSGGD